MLLIFVVHLCKVPVLLNAGEAIPFLPKQSEEKELCYSYKYTHFFMPYIINKIFNTTTHAYKFRSYGTTNNTASLS